MFESRKALDIYRVHGLYTRSGVVGIKAIKPVKSWLFRRKHLFYIFNAQILKILTYFTAEKILEIHKYLKIKTTWFTGSVRTWQWAKWVQVHFQYFSVMGVKLLIREYENPNRDDNRPLRSHLNLLDTHFAVIISHHASLPGKKGSNFGKNGWE